MNSRAILTAFLIITFCSTGFGQRIKYKDLFVLLNAKQFAEAEPFLKKYLKDTDDNPNAYLFMGMIYQEKASKLDVLKQARELVTQLDSAVYFYDKANKGMTEKEVSRNEEYYQMYNRRDLRTGKFMVKLSDVLLDLENRMKLKERGTLILTLKAQFTAAENYYMRANRLFGEIQKNYPGQKELILRADDKLLSDFRQLALLYDSCHISFNDYKATAETIGKTGYNLDLDPQEINDFKKDGLTPADFYHDDLKLWDYKRWALSSLELLEKDINPMKDQLVVMDGEINKVHQKLKKDSMSVRAEITALRAKMTFSALQKVDPQPLPLSVFEMKLSELEYGSQVVEDRMLKDSVSIFLQANAIRRELRLARRIDSTATIAEGILEVAEENYKHFITTSYGTSSVLRSLIKATREFAIRETLRKENELKRQDESLRWIIDGQDSIPLFVEVPASSRFKPLILQAEKHTAGLLYADSIPSGYFYTISTSRKPEVKAMFPVDKQAFKKRYLPFMRALLAQDEKGLVYFIMFYSEAKIKDKFPGTITKIYRAEGLSWTIDYSFDQLPTEMIFFPESFELLVKTKSSLGEIFPVNFDKNGKVLK